ncbi:UDP-glucose,sterol transferase, putative [Talaromyces stipitatus ATCC 10500]|uniref:UDP-glucose,sterol transferase, putative n=1 Tax=Talaromyces stipitatus (strain ATCC 10500 / CBS 375.48 / QM 6759 / NRRL 1006) TaxID=441959 RepID=B8M0M2_TALSN|nr:UDP-glucose,sterol transferase, putative [Talaromyces stipitatus ATCC 10500]EED21405.1 UDP-glucose,sterol transferase, putative [Talaromyces stipitatus ATCC 10500]
MALPHPSGGHTGRAASYDLSQIPTHEDFSVGEEIPMPVYSKVYGRMDLANEGLKTQASINDEGRVNIDIDEPTSRLRAMFKLPTFGTRSRATTVTAPILPSRDRPRDQNPPPLNIVIQVVGSRGDVQPFIALGRVLKFHHGHRVRLATHESFQGFVEENGLEFFNIGGDPMELMAFMVKNPGLMPGFDALKNGDIRRRRMEIASIISGCWRSCFEAGDGTGMPVSDRNTDLKNFHGGNVPFVADAIIANPPSFAHVHCAEKLGIPLHIMFTMPWSPTQAFPHPLASINRSNADAGITNYVSYAIVEMMTWQGLGDIINRFREKSLGLAPISLMWAPSMIARLKIPHTYCWSPALIPKPNDWGNHIDIAGFYFLSLASNYTPSVDLAAFLDAGPPPIYIGFGSIVVDDPNHMTQLIFDAVRLTGQRALVSKGWGGLGTEQLGVPEGVFMLGNCPHDWLFHRVSCVVHHGGAGTTAAGIAAGRSTVIVPFFGDQPFWGAMVAKAGAGPQPIPYKQLTAEKLADAIKFALEPATSEKAASLAAKIEAEHGSEDGAISFQNHLNVEKMRCSLDPDRTAVFRIKRTQVRLSALAFAVLNVEGKLGLDDVKLYRSKEYMTEADPTDPVIGGGAAMLDSIEEFLMGFADLSIDVKRSLNTRIARSRSQSPASVSRKSASQSPAGSPTTAARAKILSDDDSVKNLTEISTVSTKGSTSRPLSGDLHSSTVPTTDRLFDDSTRVETQSVNSLPLPKETRTRKHARTINDIHDIDLDGIVSAGKSAAKLVNVGLRAPASFTMAVAKGFHNAPLLYGDDTVREQPKVTGIKSGFKAAGKEFGYGFYDGISGLATQPVQGVIKEGPVGAIKGITKGIGGLIFKPAAAVWSLTGYPMSGIYKEIQKRFGESVENYIMASRCAQGLADLSNCTTEEKENILMNWSYYEADIVAKRNARRNRKKSNGTGKRARSGTIGDRSKDGENTASERDTESVKAAERANRRQSLRQLFRGRSNSSPPPRTSTPDSALPDEYEHAIRHSVLATSQRNDTEDEMIERALRASMTELRDAKADGEEEERAYSLAVEASIREAERVIEEKKREREARGTVSEVEKSNHIHAPESQPRSKSADEAGKEQRKYPPKLPPRSSVSADHDAEMENALKESKKSYEDDLRREKEEMDILVEYVKRQSLAEAEQQKQQQKPADVQQEKAMES